MLNTYGGRRLILGNSAIVDVVRRSRRFRPSGPAKVIIVADLYCSAQSAAAAAAADLPGPALKLHLTSTAANLFTACGPGFLRINDQEIRENVVVMPDRIVGGWARGGLAELSATDIEPLARLGLQVVLLGTGRRQFFPGPHVLRPLAEAQVGFEVMDTAAACRTFNVLAAEGRRVAAAVLIIDDPEAGG